LWHYRLSVSFLFFSFLFFWKSLFLGEDAPFPSQPVPAVLPWSLLFHFLSLSFSLVLFL
jgi:hypothetical protein